MPNIRELIGAPYKIHGRSREEGFDCYGILKECIRQDYNIELPDCVYKTLEEQEKISDCIHSFDVFEKIDNLQKKCIIELSVKGLPMHCGYYLGDGLFIHSVQRLGVIVEPVRRWKNKILGVYKVKSSSL